MPCWRSPREGFERPLTTLVHDGEQPSQGAEVGLAVEPESVLVFPASPQSDRIARCYNPLG